jgi:hypothetical protein
VEFYKTCLKRAFTGAWDAANMEPDFARDASLSSIHGEVLMQLGRREDALKLLERSLQMRIDGSLGADSIGWGKVCLGYAYCVYGRRREGTPLVEEGTTELEQFGSPGFVVRAKKRVAALELKRANIRRAFQVVDEAREIAEKHQLRDQLADLDRFGGVLASYCARLFRCFREGGDRTSGSDASIRLRC